MTLYEVVAFVGSLLWQHINQISNADKRSAFLFRLNELITIAAEPTESRSGNSLLYMIWYDICNLLLKKQLRHTHWFVWKDFW